jgi:nicotinamidase-related amidase
MKVATKDFHPPDHISFASNHPSPNNEAFKTMITIENPENPQETQQTLLWPDHCIQGTKGAELLPELDIGKVQHIVEKGQDKRVEMYSAFADPFTNPTISKSNLAQLLKDAQVTDVYVVGLAADYCVKFTALDAQKEGFNTFVVKEGTRPVAESNLSGVYEEYEKVGVQMISKGEVEQTVTG